MDGVKPQIIVGLILTTFSGVFGYYFPTLIKGKPTIEYIRVPKEKFIDLPKALDGRVQILVDGNNESNLSVLDVAIYNRSSQDLRNIPLTFLFYDDKNLPLPKLLGRKFSQPDQFPDDSIQDKSELSSNKIRYNISSLPENSDSYTDFVASFIFAGTHLPGVKVQSDYAIDGKIVAIDEMTKEKFSKIQAIKAIVTLLIGSAIAVTFLIWQAGVDRKRTISRIKDAADIFYRKNAGLVLTKEMASHLATESYEYATRSSARKKNNLEKDFKDDDVSPDLSSARI